MSNQQGNGYHVRLSVTGRPEDIFIFKELIMGFDSDFPFDFVYSANKNRAWLLPKTKLQCSKCKGAFWRLPRLLGKRMRVLGQQCGVNVKVKAFAEASNCAA